MLWAERLFTDRQRALEERPGLCVGGERPRPERPKRIEQMGRLHLVCLRRRPSLDQGQSERIKPSRSRPGFWIAVNALFGVGFRRCPDQRTQRVV